MCRQKSKRTKSVHITSLRRCVRIDHGDSLSAKRVNQLSEKQILLEDVKDDVRIRVKHYCSDAVVAYSTKCRSLADT